MTSNLLNALKKYETANIEGSFQKSQAQNEVYKCLLSALKQNIDVEIDIATYNENGFVVLSFTPVFVGDYSDAWGKANQWCMDWNRKNAGNAWIEAVTIRVVPGKYLPRSKHWLLYTGEFVELPFMSYMPNEDGLVYSKK